VRGDMFRLLMQPFSDQLKAEQVPYCGHSMGSHIVYIWSTCEGTCSTLTWPEDGRMSSRSMSPRTN